MEVDITGKFAVTWATNSGVKVWDTESKDLVTNFHDIHQGKLRGMTK